MVSIDNLIYNTLLELKAINLPRVGSLHTNFEAAKQVGGKVVAPSTAIVFWKKAHPDAKNIVDLIAGAAECDQAEANRLYDQWLERSNEGRLRIEGVGTVDGKEFTASRELLTLLNNGRTDIPEQHKKCTGRIWLIVLIVLLLAGGCFWWFCGSKMCCRPVVETVEEVTLVMPADSTEMPEVTPQEAVAQHGKQSVGSYKYYVVAGVFRDPQNAERYSAKLKKQDGFSVEKLPFGDDMTMVTVFGSDNRKEAQRFLNHYYWVDEDYLWVWENE